MFKLGNEERRRIEEYTRVYDQVHVNLDRAILGLNNLETNWQPSPSSNSIGNLLKHIVGAESFWLREVLNGIQIDRDRESEFLTKKFDIVELLKELKLIRNHAHQALAELVDKDLEYLRSYQSRQDGVTKKVSVHWCILHIIEHTALHTGQIFYIRKMYADFKPHAS